MVMSLSRPAASDVNGIDSIVSVVATGFGPLQDITDIGDLFRDSFDLEISNVAAHHNAMLNQQFVDFFAVRIGCCNHHAPQGDDSGHGVSRFRAQSLNYGREIVSCDSFLKGFEGGLRRVKSWPLIPVLGQDTGFRRDRSGRDQRF